MKVNDIVLKLYERLQDKKRPSAWIVGVYYYAFDLLNGFAGNDDLTSDDLEHRLLNGAKDWMTYSWGERSLIYDVAIAERLCTPSELKRKDHGRLRPNRREEWLDRQAKALKQAYHIIHYIILREEL